MRQLLKKICVIIVTFSFVLNLTTLPSHSKPLPFNDDLIMAKVIEVIDGEAIKVIEIGTDSPQVRLIRFIGVKTNASQEAMDYTYNQLIGKAVFLVSDTNEDTFPKVENWEYKYVYHTLAQSISEELLEHGYADIDEAFISASQYEDLIESQTVAKQNKVGIWKDYINVKNDDVVNINVASTTDLANILEDTNSTTAYHIYRYRLYNPYNSIEEILFASDSIDKEWFDKNKSKLNVVTDINTAGMTELASLFPYYYNNEDIAENIKQYRLFNSITKIEDLKKVDGVTDSHYKNIQNFISVTPMNHYNDEELEVANVNTATKKQLKEVLNITDSRIDSLIKLRDDQDYTFKTIGELEKVYYVLGGLETYKLIDNLSAYTDLNTAGEYELKTLFGYINLSEGTINAIVKNIIKYRPYAVKSELKTVVGVYYDDIESYIYADKSELPQLTNVNLGTKSYVASALKMNSTDEKKYTDSKKKYTTYKDFDFSYEPYNEHISLYTNINTASFNELYHLSSKLSTTMTNRIIEYRQEQPFTSLEEVNTFFSEYGYHDAYTEIKNYIVFY